MSPPTIKEHLRVHDQTLWVEHQLRAPTLPTLVFLHDSLGCVQLWRDFPHVLAEATRCNMLLYDRLGYGKSAPMPTHHRPVHYLEQEADVLQELLSVLDIKNALLFGHSDGGSIALIAASTYPQRIGAVICEAAHIFVEDVTLQGIQHAKEAYHSTNLPQRLQKYHGAKVDTLFKAWTETWTRSEYRNWSIEHLLGGIRCPLLFMQGEADEYGTRAQVERTLAGVNGTTEMWLIPGVGHSPHREVPEAVIAQASRFIMSQLPAEDWR